MFLFRGRGIPSECISPGRVGWALMNITIVAIAVVVIIMNFVSCSCCSSSVMMCHGSSRVLMILTL